MQRGIFRDSEGDAWLDRNRSALEGFSPASDPVTRLVQPHIRPQWTVAEVGCGPGHRLAALSKLTGGSGFGIDPSRQALEDAATRYPQLKVAQATAEALPWEDGSVDLLIYGFCLYLCDRDDLFKIASEGDRVLRSEGILAVLDFHPPFPYRTAYKHRTGLSSFKMEYARMWSWNPSYTIIAQDMFDHDSGSAQSAFDPHGRVSVGVLLKQPSIAYPEYPAV